MTSAPPEAPVAPGSGAHDLVGYDVDLSAGDGTARVVLDLAPKHLNRNGSLHGGIIAMMLDASAGFAASLAGGPDLVPVVTVALNTQYLAPAISGRVTATGHVKQAGRSICYADADLRDAAGKLLATGNGVFKYMRKEGGT
ncbi:PaaI family thioesterase [Sedimentitalea sp. JM2-8]|uniref:PaaI family thioesterase n=1 Tax=Sedimentitalea xiamensis TaxID=3050037 RepID=A0ABT7FI16_9RHOB|nr:PaaI family thioesterase [Sedimentitalea xiamensis]MDK3074784.1 PaaI family thioesterase [Sedimentitalea xiamensis]